MSNTSPTGSNADGDSATSESPSPTKAANPTFGQTVTSKSGLSITVGKARPYSPSDYAAIDKKSAAYRVFSVTIVNKTGQNYDPNGFYTTMQSGDQEAEEVFDSPRLEGSPSTTLLDGRQAKFDIGFGLKDPQDFVMDVSFGDDDLTEATWVRP